jgi:CelD/BcsL family acetyltransferase involved in cellulose biosynthesis
VAHADVFRKDNDRAFISEYSLELAQRGQLRIFQLLIGGSVVATRLAFQFNGEIYLYYSGYDPAWAKYSVMTTLLVEAMKWSIDRRLAILHLSTGSDVSKLRWSPIATRYFVLTEVPLNWRAILSFGVYQKAQRIASWLARSRSAAGARRQSRMAST